MSLQSTHDAPFLAKTFYFSTLGPKNEPKWEASSSKLSAHWHTLKYNATAVFNCKQAAEVDKNEQNNCFLGTSF